MKGMGPRIEREWQTVRSMVALYCRTHHAPGTAPKGGLCPACQELARYAENRLRLCPFQEGKTTCVKCPVHCYTAARREEIKKIMRFAGPRIMYHKPILSLLHMIDGLRKEPLRQGRVK